MVDAWVEEDEGGGELPMPPAELQAESARRIAQSTAQGRGLAAAFLREAALR